MENKLNSKELKGYFNSGRILFVKIIDFPDYKGTSSDFDEILNQENISGFKGVNEIENFLVREDGNVYGYVESGYIEYDDGNSISKKINIENIDENYVEIDSIDNCLIIFVSLKTSQIVGYYKNATVYRERQKLDNPLSCHLKIEKIKEQMKLDLDVKEKVEYNIKTSKKDTYLFPIYLRLKVNVKQGENGTLNIGQSNIKYLDNKNKEYAEKVLQLMIESIPLDDYQNFFDMLKFWINQTNNNIENKGKRVHIAKITSEETKLNEAVIEYKSPQFYKRYIFYSNFIIHIIFFIRSYKGNNVNFITSPRDSSCSDWINIRYDYEERKLKAIYYLDGKGNNELQDYKEHMYEKGYADGYEINIVDLELENNEPNQNVRELFDYFSQMIEDSKKYWGLKNTNPMVEKLKNKLLTNYNMILRGAPGTGKTYLAKEIAASIIGVDIEDLAKSNQFAFVQFHPSYDYTDFVEGLRPINYNNGISFEVKKGLFYEFCEKAKSSQVLNIMTIKGLTVDGFEEYLLKLKGEDLKNKYIHYIKILLGKENYTGRKKVQIPTFKDLKEILEKQEDIKEFDRDEGFNRWFITPVNYLTNYEKELGKIEDSNNGKGKDKKYVFVIDEINRGEISKIFGELFFSIDSGYRGTSGSVHTQYSNLHDNEDEMFYVPENVYIIGTMNDIDRSVDTFDFAMRRRFLFEEITAEQSAENMNLNADVKEIMGRLNKAIVNPNRGGLSKDYQIGGSYYLGVNNGKETEDELWDNRIEPLLKEYYRGDYGASEKLLSLKAAYFNEEVNE